MVSQIFKSIYILSKETSENCTWYEYFTKQEMNYKQSNYVQTWK